MAETEKKAGNFNEITLVLTKIIQNFGIYICIPKHLYSTHASLQADYICV